ncbi:uncharacterized protein PV07_09903 [Cladophialophora immunda]|uniref:N,N-dimethylformamidase beta subunit-like C-terminal domain-containing protein n=1 Tax=Cladophialophora immunda TaxID=569365 RepID=A0A0D2BYH0_9EURO|nr:uncharacterized protein PV07_09903 [Cladophialophora immunda]KIW24173.1 hypothetical protein PV07_09903 [Cladophialophora immunda]
MTTIVPVPKDYPKEIIGYAEPWIVSPGESVDIKVSCTEARYNYRTVRVIQGHEGEKSPRHKEEEITEIPRGSRDGRYQVAHIGSYGRVKDIGLTAADNGLKISVYVQPWLIPCNHVQALVSTLDASSKTGIDVVLDQEGQLEFWVGCGADVQVVCSGFTPVKRRWFKLDLTVCGTQLEAVLTPKSRITEPAAKQRVFTADLKSPIKVAACTPLLVAASRQASPQDNAPTVVPTNKYNGRLDSLELRTTGARERVLAKYDFAVEMSGDRFLDVSPAKRHGDLVNAPSRAMKGHDWDGSETDWTKAKYGYGAIHFHEDDLDDAEWDTDFTIQIPKDARSGVYSVVIRGGDDDVGENVVFYVRPTAATTAKIGAKVAIVMSTFTYLAYANDHMFDPDTPARAEIPAGLDNLEFYKDETFYKQDRRRDLGLSHYDVHKDHSGVVFSSAKRPLLNNRPDYINWSGHRPRELSAELIMVGFLDRSGVPYDVVTDHDLHIHGASMLAPYTTVITGCHPEYPTLQSYAAYEGFVQQGGNMMYLGGNGFYWVSVTDPKRPWRSEVRRGGQGVRTSWQEPGERHHSLNGQQGGLWRDYGKAANYLVGIGCCGEGHGAGVAYRQTEDLRQSHPELASWLFRDIPEGQLIGENSLGEYGGGASADEIDRVDFAYGSPANVVVVASSVGHSDDFGLFPEDVSFPIQGTLGTQTDLIRSDMTYYETSGGGAVFSVGSISWYCGLGYNGYDNTAALVTRNVLLEFAKGPKGTIQQ